jgi:hypothetical protein
MNRTGFMFDHEHSRVMETNSEGRRWKIVLQLDKEQACKLRILRFIDPSANRLFKLPHRYPCVHECLIFSTEITTSTVVI